MRPRKKKKHNTRRTCRGKVRYRDQQEAIAALHRLQGRLIHSQQRAYDCARCSGWHLTSWTTATG